MPILYAEIQVVGLSAVCAVAAYSFDQTTDYTGRPSSTVHLGLLKVVLTGEAAAWPVWETLMLDPYRRTSGHLVFFEGEGQTAKRYTFYDAALVHYECRFDARGQSPEAALQVELHFSAATADVQGQRLEAHSIIPWETDAATSFRALTKPPEPLPSVALAALTRTGALKAETLASGLLKRVITPAGEVATELLGVGVAAIARAASLTLGLVLTPANNPDAPGYDAEKNFLKDHPLLPPDPDAFRLAQLEATHANGTLAPAEEAEYIALLAKVKGIRINHINDLADAGAATLPLKGLHVPLRNFTYIPNFPYTKRAPADKALLRRKFDSSGRSAFLKGLAKDPAKMERMKKLGLNDDDLEAIKDGLCPDGYQVHHKLSLDDGGDNSPSNLVLIKDDPYHRAITAYQNSATRGLKPGATQVIDWPTVDDYIYPNY